jgi:predicted negative regulator of RcsB-dependent stress response
MAPGLDDPETFYRKLIAEDPESTLPRFSLAKLDLERGGFPEAIALLRFCVARQPDWAVALLLLGDALAGLGDAAGARDSYALGRDAADAQHHDSLVQEAEEKLEALGGR